MYRKILVGYDRSESSKRAFEIALRRAAKDGAELYVLAVAQRHVIADEVESRAELDDSVEYYRKALASLRKVTLAAGVKARFEVAVGDSADQLIRHADHYGPNLIVLGERGSKLRQWLFGSVAQEVARYPGCPVLVVH
jgi:nucleotide-binding universal stress UspA family protein